MRTWQQFMEAQKQAKKSVQRPTPTGNPIVNFRTNVAPSPIAPYNTELAPQDAR